MAESGTLTKKLYREPAACGLSRFWEEVMPEEQEHWHLRKELSIGTIISLALLTGSGFAAYASLAQSVDNLETEPKVELEQVARIEERQKELKEDVEDIKRDVKRLPAIEQSLSDLKDLIRRELDQDN